MSQTPFISGGGTQLVVPIEPAVVLSLDAKEDKNKKGGANGYAPLDGNAKVPVANLPDTASLDAEVDGKITTHNSATTDVHGIANTEVLVTAVEEVTSNLNDHYNDQTAHNIQGQIGDRIYEHGNESLNVHGIANTANLVLTNDPRLADSRQPTAHTHTKSEITDFTHPHVVEDVTGLQDALNGKQASGSYAPATGIFPSAITGTAVITNDPRLSDNRTPNAHKSSHATEGTDALTPADIGAVPVAYPTVILGDDGTGKPALPKAAEGSDPSQDRYTLGQYSHSIIDLYIPQVRTTLFTPYHLNTAPYRIILPNGTAPLNRLYFALRCDAFTNTPGSTNPWPSARPVNITGPDIPGSPPKVYFSYAGSSTGRGVGIVILRWDRNSNGTYTWFPEDYAPATGIAPSAITGTAVVTNDSRLNLATTSANGLMSSTDKSKLDGVAEPYNVITMSHSSGTLTTNNEEKYFGNFTDSGISGLSGFPSGRGFILPFAQRIVGYSLTYYLQGPSPANLPDAELATLNYSIVEKPTTDSNTTTPVGTITTVNVHNAVTLKTLGMSGEQNIQLIQNRPYVIKLTGGTFTTFPTSLRSILMLWLKS